jgi:hypothetical protein
MYPAIEDVQDYRVSFDLSLSVQLNGWLQWNLNVADRYLNIPPSGGAIQNDTFISTGPRHLLGSRNERRLHGSERPTSPTAAKIGGAQLLTGQSNARWETSRRASARWRPAG